MRSLKKLNAAAGTGFTRWAQVIHALAGENNPPGFEAEYRDINGEAYKCASPVCSTMICVKCGECPNSCGFDQDEHNPHDDCREI